LNPANPKLEELLVPTDLPPELAWISAHYRLHPDDPVYLILAWHWRRVKQSEDTLAAGIIELRTLLDSRATSFAQAASAVQGVTTALADVEAALAEKPAELSSQLDLALTQTLDQALARMEALEKALSPLVKGAEAIQRRQVLSALLIGVTFGLLGSLILLL